MKKIVLLRSDMSGEDEAYTICAVEIDTNHTTVECVCRCATAIMDAIRGRDEYDDRDLVVSLKQAGFKVVLSEEIIVRS